MNKAVLPPCRRCQYCENIGRQMPQRNNLGRKRYYCSHPRTSKLKDRYGFPLYPFIGYGDMTVKSPLVLKSRKKWCPLREVRCGGPDEEV